MAAPLVEYMEYHLTIAGLPVSPPPAPVAPLTSRVRLGTAMLLLASAFAVAFV
jgi:hypothetical protein